MQYKLSQVDPESFPLLYFNNEIKESLTSDPQLPKNIISACNNLQIHIEPTENLDYSHVKENFNLNAIPQKIADKLKNNAEDIQSLKSSIDQWRTEHPFKTFPTSTDIEVVTLGTGSALPSKYRNGKIEYSLFLFYFIFILFYIIYIFYLYILIIFLFFYITFL